MLARQPLGPASQATRLVLAHGFTQNARCWGAFGDHVSTSFDAVALDAPGHGQSGYDNADLFEAGRLLLESGGIGHYLGYSMGGRMLLHGALRDTLGVVKSLILIGATPGIEDSASRVARKSEDAQLASHLETIGTKAFVDEWLAKPMFSSLTPEQSSHTKRFENAPDGMASSLRNCGTGSQTPLWDQLSTLRIPILVIAGTEDEVYTTIGQRMVATIGSNARFVGIEGGHAVHLENPAVTAAVVAQWGSQLG